MKVLYLYPGARSPVLDYEKRLVEQINSTESYGIEIAFWDWTADLKLDANPSLEWTQGNIAYFRTFYAQLKQRAKLYDIVFIGQTGGILPEVMAEIPSCVIYNTADDPDSSERCSFPFLQVADVIAYAGVNYDSERDLEEVFLGRGARRCIHFPIGFYEEMFPPMADFDAVFDARDIDLVYIGHVKRGELPAIMRRYWDMRIYSRSLRLKHKLYLLGTTGRWVRPYYGDLGALYRRCKVGINIHYTYGPSNARMYQLNASGVAQLLDCPEGHSRIYCPGDEIVGYSTLEEAFSQIDLLLRDDEYRYRIARAGYDRARRDYNRRNIFVRVLKSSL